MLAVTLVIHSVLYLSYVDLLPTGFWRYLNVHYWTWAFPGFALLAVLLLRDLLSARFRLPAAAALAAVILLLCVRIVRCRRAPAPQSARSISPPIPLRRPPLGRCRSTKYISARGSSPTRPVCWTTSVRSA